jgi:FMN phosphatase YigB (HAD superfamily)
MKTFIFDLDHTVIDSSHRQLTRPDGSLDLAHWRENCTREKIFRDRLMPLANFWRRVYDAQHTVIVATARVMTRHDFDYLHHHNLRFDSVVHRQPGEDTPDAEMKTAKLARLFSAGNIEASRCVMFDDNTSVRHMVRRELGVKAFHPKVMA